SLASAHRGAQRRAADSGRDEPDHPGFLILETTIQATEITEDTEIMRVARIFRLTRKVKSIVFPL
ncbi:MAG: hypothetical protein Q8J61_03865, partial [Sulfuricella sp.]|nr:hypothetical protein [Sulfuricella sp.]